MLEDNGDIEGNQIYKEAVKKLKSVDPYLKLSQNKFLYLIMPRESVLNANYLKKAFAVLDKNKNGELQREEFTKLMGFKKAEQYIGEEDRFTEEEFIKLCMSA